MQQTLDISNDVAAELASIGDSVLDALREQLDCKINLRGNRLTIDGGETEVEQARAVIDEIVELVEGGHEIGSGTVDAVVSALDKEQDIREVLEAGAGRPRGKKAAPKPAAQKEYADATRRPTVTFGIGPAGTGKTYLAIALAVAALSERQVGRIILTRPAVEAGERPRLLPGGGVAEGGSLQLPPLSAPFHHPGRPKAQPLLEGGPNEGGPPP